MLLCKTLQTLWSKNDSNKFTTTQHNKQQACICAQHPKTCPSKHLTAKQTLYDKTVELTHMSNASKNHEIFILKYNSAKSKFCSNKKPFGRQERAVFMMAAALGKQCSKLSLKIMNSLTVSVKGCSILLKFLSFYMNKVLIPL